MLVPSVLFLRRIDNDLRSNYCFSVHSLKKLLLRFQKIHMVNIISINLTHESNWCNIKFNFGNLFLRKSRYSEQGHVRDYPVVVSQDTPHHLCFKMFKSFPVTNHQVEAPFEI